MKLSKEQGNLQQAMENYFYSITEANKLTLNKGGNRDAVYYSELNEWFTCNAFRSFSLKYVVDQCIYYRIGNKEHAVPAGSLLLACKQPDVRAFFDSRRLVKSICIDINPATVAEAFSVMSATCQHEFDNFLAGYFRYPDFYEELCPVGSVRFAGKLHRLVQLIKSGEAHTQINKEWFLALVEDILCHEYGNYLALSGLKSVKLATRKELLARLQQGKQYMNENFLCISDIGEVATVSHMSEFHFFRSFRQAFGITPYQYLLQRRLEHARNLLRENECSITGIAAHCNFPDIFTFSKAFKRHFGIPPSQCRPA